MLTLKKKYYGGQKLSRKVTSHDEAPIRLAMRDPLGSQVRKIVKETLEQKKADSTHNCSYRRRIPFMTNVLRQPPSLKFEFSQLSMYHGRRDPTQHSEQLEYIVLLYRWNDGSIYCIFPLNLNKPCS